jgi:hypothetical protein
MEEERNVLVLEAQKAAESHAKVVQSLRAEFESQRKLLSETQAFKNQSQDKEVRREITLEANNLEYTNAIASATRALEEKHLELKRVEAEKNWLTHDNQALKEQLAATKKVADTDREHVCKYLLLTHVNLSI